MIVSLAGHVDHGKTSLVRALTGIDTDRLEQEKRRGLTIDLGFAYIDDGNIGFVDVPGHHKFIHNMVAGVASHQHALLVIAADDGPMPQSKEHLDIMRLAGIESGVIALTKRDRVDGARLARCKQEIKQLVQGSFMEHAPVLATSIDDAVSIEQLLAHLRGTAAAFTEHGAHEPFRLAIDRTFLVRGAGLIVTGMAHAGAVKVDDVLHHFPSDKPVRVRSIRAQDQIVESARSGERCALNITGLELDEVKRGDWVNAEAAPHYREISVLASVLDDFPRTVKHWTPVHIYHATSHSAGRIALLDDAPTAPGGSAMVDLICDEPLAVRHGDQLVLRDQSLDVTLGGAKVVYAQTRQSLRRRSEERGRMLTNYSTEKPSDCLTALLADGMVDVEPFRQIWHLTQDQLTNLLADRSIVLVGEIAIDEEYWTKLQAAALAQINEHQEIDPSSPGLKENEITRVPTSIRQPLLNDLVQHNKLSNDAGLYRLPEHEAKLPTGLQEAWQRFESALDQKQAPSTGDLAKLWRVPQQQLENELKELTKRGLVTHVANHRFYLPSQLQDIADDVKNMAAKKPFSVREFRDLTGIGRNVAIEVLEYFDRRGFTRRQDNERIVLKNSL